MMPQLRIDILALAMTLSSPCLAAPQPVIPEDVQKEAITCVGEAAQICPEVWTAEDHGLACMTGKREAFSPRCRVIYDKVARVLHQAPHDVAKPHGP